tara:strand:- start:386 stop:718 length:333 start_codon:yes stop_codon:yes gene_type:complete
MMRRNYNSSLSKISTLLPKVLKNLKKTNKNSSKLLELKMKWKDIIGDKISEDIFVDSVKKLNNKNVLIIISKKPNLVEISYSSEMIKDKINKHFNECFIDNIKFKRSLHF